jgi:hypothetical protein
MKKELVEELIYHQGPKERHKGDFLFLYFEISIFYLLRMASIIIEIMIKFVVVVDTC